MPSFARVPGHRFTVAIFSILAILGLLVIGAGWYYSSLLKSGGLEPDYSPDKLNMRVVAIDGGLITLTAGDGGDVNDLKDDELWGLEGENGYGQVKDILRVDGNEVTRVFQPMTGEIHSGDAVRLDSFAFRGDPMAARGVSFRAVSIPSDLGDLPAWRVDGSDTWVIFVHGFGSDREEALRILPTVSDLGLSSLVITYRNDEEAPRSPDGLIRWGATEWQDLEAAVDYASGAGARSVILYGYSMGGGIVAAFLERSDRADIVAGAILDSPVLNFSALLSFQARQQHVPGIIVSIGKQFAARRFDLDWDEMNFMPELDLIHVPILLFHGDDDERAPISTSEQFAAQRPDIVTYVVGKTAGHVRNWNIGPAAYEETVRRFLVERIQGVSP
ncbi:MAG TPA: prolyl oligopeptidase family serine peptidase [Dehalococcoidia bacterium]|jgi:pimeloyl-ACP methyl ester carboxylesterase|nr:prolyl oligopeptidase family serine peptidase [Dehalococcoidia bacterium]